jgi:hypothetical protein
MDLYSLNTVVAELDDGMSRIGIYWIADGMVNVAYLGKLPVKSAQIGRGGNTKALAFIVLREHIDAE